MPNVPVPPLLRIELASSNLVVWEAKRTKKGEPVTVVIAGPGLTHMPQAWGATIEEAVDRALKSTAFVAQSDGILGALKRLEIEMFRLQVAIYCDRVPDDLDDDVPF